MSQHIDAVAKQSGLETKTVTDLNTAIEKGTYFFATNATNSPDKNYTGVVEVVKGANNIVWQMVTNSNNRTFTRLYAPGSNTWSDWKELALNSNTAYNATSISTVANLTTFLNNIPVGKTSFIIASDEAANAVSGLTYITNITATRISAYFIDLIWGVGDSATGVTRYNSNNNTFSINNIMPTVETVTPIKGSVKNGNVRTVAGIHIINIRYQATEAISAGENILTLPFSAPSQASVALANNRDYPIDIVGNKVRVNGDVAKDDVIILSGVY